MRILIFRVIFPKTLFQPQQLYQFMHEILRIALNAFGYQVELKSVKSKIPIIRNKIRDFACFTQSAYSEVQYKDKKVVGSAQKVYRDAILQHGSILIGQTHKRLVNFLKTKQEIKKKIETELAGKTISLLEIKNMHVTPETIVRSIIEKLTLHCKIHCYYQEINPSELNQACLFVTKQMERPIVFQRQEIEIH